MALWRSCDSIVNVKTRPPVSIGMWPLAYANESFVLVCAFEMSCALARWAPFHSSVHGCTGAGRGNWLQTADSVFCVFGWKYLKHATQNHTESYSSWDFVLNILNRKNNKETSMQICGNCYRTTVGVCVTLLCLDGRNKANHMLLVAVSVERCIDDKLKIWVTHYK